MPGLATTYRRPVTAALLIVAGFATVLVAAAMWNPWRLTALYPLAATGGAIAVLTLAGALAVMAIVLSLGDNGRHALIALVVGLVAVPALCVGLPIVAFHDAFRDRQVHDELVLATSPGGGFAVVAVTTDGGTALKVRSQRMLLSQEGAAALAWCDHNPFGDTLPPESVRFTAEHTVAVPMGVEAQTVTVTFDPDTLEAPQTVSMCPADAAN